MLAGIGRCGAAMRNIRKSAYGAMYLKEAFSSNQDSTLQGTGARRLTKLA